MIENFDLCRLMSELSKEYGWGAFIAVYNDIENKWSYLIGEYKEKNPSNFTYSHNINGIDVTHLFTNKPMYFIGEMVDKGKVITFVNKSLGEKKINVSFDFRVVRF